MEQNQQLVRKAMVYIDGFNLYFAIVVFPPGRSHYLGIKLAADSCLEITRKKLLFSLLPERITTPNGFVIEKPTEYR